MPRSTSANPNSTRLPTCEHSCPRHARRKRGLGVNNRPRTPTCSRSDLLTLKELGLTIGNCAACYGTLIIHEARHVAHIRVLPRTQGIAPPFLDLSKYRPDGAQRCCAHRGMQLACGGGSEGFSFA